MITSLVYIIIKYNSTVCIIAFLEPQSQQDLFNTDYQITILEPGMQARLNQATRSPMVTDVHEAHYSMLAYPFATDYQNSNQWVLEFIEGADSGQNTRSRIQQQLQEKGYKPTIIAVDRLTKLTALFFRVNVSIDDHPIAEQNSNHYSVVTVDSIIDFLQKQHKVVRNLDRRAL